MQSVCLSSTSWHHHLARRLDFVLSEESVQHSLFFPAADSAEEKRQSSVEHCEWFCSQESRLLIVICSDALAVS